MFLILSAPTPSDGTGLESVVVNRLSVETGTLFVTSAGNTWAPDSIGGPGRGRHGRRRRLVRGHQARERRDSSRCPSGW
ncbi:hypothetical protein [Streptomyces sp. NPDC002463]|uniref:hypothetical protein n=1 Tax=Streptomyces sp. NPDC002463 TaxID=3364645 RepID=UPI0036CBFD19